MVKITTKERYVRLYNKLQAINFDLTTLDSITFMEFNQKIGSKGQTEGQFNLAKALARNIQTQKNVNIYLKQKKIPAIITKPMIIKPYIQPIVKKPIIIGATPKFKFKINKKKHYTDVEIDLYYKFIDILLKTKNVYNMKVKKMLKKPYPIQEVQLLVNFNIFDNITNKKGKKTLRFIQSNNRLFKSGLYSNKTLLNLYQECLILMDLHKANKKSKVLLFKEATLYIYRQYYTK